MNYLFTYLKGLAMGAADVVPGVSGGTIAFITGIYDTLLLSIKRITPQLLKIWKQQGFKAAFNHINGFFLLSLGAGIATSIFTLAKLVSWLLVAYPIPLWSFFLGLIIISSIYISRQLENKKLYHLIFFIIGAVLAYGITILQPVDLSPTWWNLLLAGALASSAMILPGLSGSFLLLLLGIYPVILSAVSGLKLDILIIFAAGIGLGLLTFSHLLYWLLNHYRQSTFTFLIGLMIGTLPKIWPWKETITTRINSDGDIVPLLQKNLLPQQYSDLTGETSQLVLAFTCFLLAIGIVLSMEYIAHKQKAKSH